MDTAQSNQEKRTIKVRDFLADFHAGVTETELIEKYQLTPSGLEKFYTMLMDRKILEPGDFEARQQGHGGVFPCRQFAHGRSLSLNTAITEGPGTALASIH